jgi:hypothetical protein
MNWISTFFHAGIWRHMAGAIVFLAITLVVWFLTMRWARRVRHQVDALIALARQPVANSLDAIDRAGELDSARRRLTALRMVTNATRYILGAAVLVSLLQLFNIPLDGLLLPAGFLGAALGLGAQSLIKDFVSGLFVVFEGQYAVGDTVTLNDKTGVVDEIGLRVTRIRDESGTLLYFPNGAINTVAKFPRRETELILSIPLAAGINAEAAAALAQTTITDFGTHFDAVKGSIRRADAPGSEITEQAPSDRPIQVEPQAADIREELAFEDTLVDIPVAPPTPATETLVPGASTKVRTLVFAVPLRPSRVALAREKLPPRITAALDAAGYKLRPGAEVGSFIAPPK